MARKESNDNDKLEKALIKLFKKYKPDFGYDDFADGRYYWYSKRGVSGNDDLYFELKELDNE